MATHDTDRTDQLQQRALRRAAARAERSAEPDAGPQPHPLVALGGRVGNAQVARTLAQRAASDDEEAIAARHDPAQREGDEEELAAKHDPVQREGDEEEMLNAQHDPAQRQSDEEEPLQAKPEVGLEGGPLSPALSGRINAARGGGSALDGGARASMEGAFGADFADVRVHTGAEADALSRSISAKAFTTGSDIFFRDDASPGDHGLLAHELTHVVQQRGGAGGAGGLSVGPAGDAHEQQADATATAVTSGAAAQAQRQAAEEEELAATHDPAQRAAVAEEEEPMM